MELLYTFIIIFVPIFLSFLIFRPKEKKFIFGWFIFMFIFVHIFHLIIISLLLSENFYKDTIIWKNVDHKYIHSLPIIPIKNINITGDKEIILEDFVDLKYTLKRTNLFNKECLNNFFIDEENCPITDIILNKFQTNDYSNYTEAKINNNLYLYYTNKNNNGSLYFKNDSNINNLPNNVFNFNKYNEEEIIKEKEVIKVIKDLKYYADYSDCICLSLFFLSLTSMILNLVYYTKLHYAINKIIQIILFIFYLLRYIKFNNLKKVFNNYKDFISIQYENSDSNKYYPNKYFNIDSFALALQINILLISILYSKIFEGCLIKKEYLPDKKEDKRTHFVYSMTFCLILLFTIIIYLIKLLKNLNKINYRLNNMLNNWNINPIKSINLDENNSPQINWKNNSLIFERISNFNYKSIFYENRYKESKICGKDSYGNDLYFPKDVECPINSIIITEDEFFDTKNEYIKLNLKHKSFLYYSNKKSDGKIIINLIITKYSRPEFNFYESEERKKFIDFDIKSYSNIENFNNKYLLASNYIGIDPKFLPKSQKIKNFDDKLKIYKKLIISIEALLISYYVIILICLQFLWGYEVDYYIDRYIMAFIIIFIIFFVPILIIISISLSINLQYVINFMNKINETYENNKVNFSWEILILIHIIIVIIFIIFTTIYIFHLSGFVNFIDQLFICNLCECGECKTIKCNCDFGYCECLKCLKSFECDCSCKCFKCPKKDNNNNNHDHIPNIKSENINFIPNEIKYEFEPLNNNINNLKDNIIEIKNNINNKCNDFNNLKKNNSDDEIKEDIVNIKNICSNCSEKINNTNNNINNCKNDINKLQNDIHQMDNNFNGEIAQLKYDVKYIRGLCEECLEKLKNYKLDSNQKDDNKLKIIIKYENNIYQIIIDNNCSYKDFINKIYNAISSPINIININNLKIYYWNQYGQKISILNEKDFLNALSFHIFYFEIINEKNNQIRQQNYISNEDN